MMHRKKKTYKIFYKKINLNNFFKFYLKKKNYTKK